MSLAPLAVSQKDHERPLSPHLDKDVSSNAVAALASDVASQSFQLLIRLWPTTLGSLEKI
jgi:hypothetical protein